MVELLSPFTMVHRRSLPQQVDILTGRWAMQNNTGRAAVPGAAAKFGLYLVLEGALLHTGSNLDFGLVGTGFASTEFVRHPTVGAVGEVALAYGIFRFRVGPEGFDPLVGYNVGDFVEVDNFGRLILFTGGAAPRVAKVEAVATDAGGITELTLLTLGA